MNNTRIDYHRVEYRLRPFTWTCLYSGFCNLDKAMRVIQDHKDTLARKKVKPKITYVR